MPTKGTLPFVESTSRDYFSLAGFEVAIIGRLWAATEGHSYGGFVAARIPTTQAHVSAIVLLAPWDPAKAIPILTVPEEKFTKTAHSVFDDVDGRLGGYADVDLAKEVLGSGYNWHLESSAPRLKNLPLLIVSAKHDTPDDQGTELGAELERLHAPDVTRQRLDSDHAFSDHRIALENTVLGWLEKRISKRPNR